MFKFKIDTTLYINIRLILMNQNLIGLRSTFLVYINLPFINYLNHLKDLWTLKKTF